MRIRVLNFFFALVFIRFVVVRGKVNNYQKTQTFVKLFLWWIPFFFSFFFFFKETPLEFKVYYTRTNSLVSVHQREPRVCFL